MRIHRMRKIKGIRQFFHTARRSRIVVIGPHNIFRALGAFLAFLFVVGLFSYFFFPKQEREPSKVSLKVYDHRKQVVVTMDLEEYITGVVAGEMPISYDLEALKAQAVAARTYAYRKTLKGPCRREGADVCTDSGHCQAYSDLESRKERWGENFKVNEAKLEQAIDETAGQIMVYASEPIEALYFSTSGGRTEDAENVYSQAVPYLRGVESPGEEGAPRFKNTVTLKATDFMKKIKDAKSKASLTAKTLAKNIKEPVRFGSGRVDSVKIGGVSFTGKEISKIFSLGTTFFSIAVQAENVIITTHGYGHGVGMSQVGANAMAKDNSTYSEILLHYYTGVTLSTI